MDKQALAESYFNQGFNCAQAVALAFADETGHERDELARLASSFGGGIGRMRHVCGALSGAVIVCGLINGSESPSDTEAKMAHYARIQTLCRAFEEEMGSMLCSELLGEDADGSPVPVKRSAAYLAQKPCVGAVCTATALTEEYIKQYK